MKTYRHLCIATAVIALTLSLASPAWAQYVAFATETVESSATVRTETTGMRLARSLASPAVEVRAQALEELTLYAHFSSGEMDLTQAVPALLAIYKDDPAEPHRLLALSALHALGNEAGMEQLLYLVKHQSSERVQRATLGALVEHFGLSAFEGDEEMAVLADALLSHADNQSRTAAADLMIDARD